ncbi:biotin--[acetyl-CoA-carboxylase] ligase [Novosphingobium sp. PS1R-30]|uniref:biotin--[biotin carboxyl-carrier protein] ligase n=1 Tax=Novosphingobium anseongense TaxID=3133436 RepID=A0ABU8RST3_9SPHN
MIHTLAETGSTNADLAARLRASESVAEGDWLVADRQTAGKGRQGREWLDGAGNFMGSTVVHLRFGDPEPASLALLVGLAVHEAVTPLLNDGLSATLKWPNDLLIGRAKLAGILLERVNDSVIIGVGVNLAQAPEVPDRETVALQGVDRDAFAADLAREFAAELERWRNFGLAPIVQRWLAAAHPLGTPLTVGEPGEEGLIGAFAGLAEDGALLLRLADGRTRAIHAGEVRLTPDS